MMRTPVKSKMSGANMLNTEMKAILFAFFLIVSVVGAFVSLHEPAEPAKPLHCYNEIMPLEPDGKSVVTYPDGWKYAGNMDGVILVQRRVCE